MPLIMQAMLYPDVEIGQPNLPAAICAANRAATQLKLGQTSEAVSDARFAVNLCPEYVKGRHRLKQALIADGRTDEAAACASSIQQFEELSKSEPGEPGLWLGFRLVVVGWLNADKYEHAYEASRARDWRTLAHFSARNIESYARLRVHMEIFPIAVRGRNSNTGEARTETWLALALNVCSNGLLLENLVENGNQNPDALASLERSQLPSIDYRYLRLVGSLEAPLKHKKFEYRGVIVGGADHTCTQSRGWMRQMGVDRLPRGRYQPWYRVLVDERDRPGGQMTYVCHDNIEIWRDPPTSEDGNPLGGPVRHPQLPLTMARFDAAKGVYEPRDLIGDAPELR